MQSKSEMNYATKQLNDFIMDFHHRNNDPNNKNRVPMNISAKINAMGELEVIIENKYYNLTEILNNNPDFSQVNVPKDALSRYYSACENAIPKTASIWKNINYSKLHLGEKAALYFYNHSYDEYNVKSNFLKIQQSKASGNPFNLVLCFDAAIIAKKALSSIPQPLNYDQKIPAPKLASNEKNVNSIPYSPERKQFHRIEVCLVSLEKLYKKQTSIFNLFFKSRLDPIKALINVMKRNVQQMVKDGINYDNLNNLQERLSSVAQAYENNKEFSPLIQHSINQVTSLINYLDENKIANIKTNNVQLQQGNS